MTLTFLAKDFCVIYSRDLGTWNFSTEGHMLTCHAALRAQEQFATPGPLLDRLWPCCFLSWGTFQGETLLWFHRAQPLFFLSFQHHWGRWKNDHNTLLLLPARDEVCFPILESGLLVCFDQWKWDVRVCHLRAYDLTGLATCALVALFPTHRRSWANLLDAETLHGKRPMNSSQTLINQQLQLTVWEPSRYQPSPAQTRRTEIDDLRKLRAK